MSDLTLGIRIKVNADGSAQVLGQTGDGITRISNASSNASRNLRDMDSSAKGLVSTMTAATAGLLAGFSARKVIDEIGSFESKMINVHALTMANAADMKAMTAQARELGATTAFSAQQAAEAQGVLASAGLKTNEILAVTPQVLQLASAGNLEMSRTAEIAIGTMRGLGLGLGDLGRISDVAAKTAADTFSSVGDIGDAMKNASPLAKAFGIDLEDMSAAIGTLADNQLKGSEAGNNFKAMLVALGNETKDKTELLARHSIAFSDLNIQQRGLVPVMDTLRKAHLSGAEAITLFGSDAAAAGLILSSNSQKLGDFSKQLDSSAGSTKTQADMLNTGLTKALDAFGGVVSEAALQIGDDTGGGLLGGLTNLVQTATGVISIYEGMGDKFAESNGLTKEQYDNLKAVSGELEIVAGAAGGIATLTAGIWLANVAMSAFNLTTKANPLILVATTAAAGIGAVIAKIDSAKKAHEDFMKSATTAEEANLKVKQQIAKINAIAPVTGAGHGATDTMIAAAKADLAILVQQRNALEEKAAATNAATEADKKSDSTTAGHIAQQTASSEATKKSATEVKKHSEAINKEIESLSDQHLKLSLSERDYELSKLSALGMSDAVKASSIAIWDSNKALEAQKNSSDKAKSEMDALTDKYNQLTLSARAYYATTLVDKSGAPLASEKAAPLMRQFDKNTAAELGQKNIDSARSSLDAYNQTLASTVAKTSDLGATNTAIFDGALGGINTLSGAFDNMVKSITANTIALDELHKKQAENASFERNAITDDARRKNNGQYLVDLKKVADNKRAYTQEEARLNNATMKDSLSGIRQMATATGAMFAENTAARKAFNIIALTASVAERAADIAGLGVKAASATLTQGQGDPYTAFARIAAMAAIVGSILAAAGAGGFNFSGASAPPKPTSSPDTGTVLGDPTAKSNSVGNVYQLLKDIQAENYPELRGINDGVASLSGGITNVITRLFQAGGVKDFATLAPKIMTGFAGYFEKNAIVPNIGPGALIGKWLGEGIFGGKQTQSVIGQGIQIGATPLSSIIAGGGLSAQQYAEVQTKTDGGWFGKDKYSSSMQYAALDAGTQKALNSLFGSMGKTMLSLSDALGLGLSDRVRNYVIPSLTVDLKGLSGEDAAKKLNGIISTALDSMSTTVFGDILGQYQKLGEGMLETAIRIVSQVAVVRDAFRQTSTHYSGDIIAISDALVQASGGTTQFQGQLSAFTDKFLTDAEKQQNSQLNLMSALASVNLVLPKARDEYRKYIKTIDVGTASGLAQYSTLIRLASAADSYYTALETGAATAAQTLTDTNAKLASDAEKAVSDAQSVLVTAYKAESSALTAVISKTTDFIAKLKTFKDTLTVGDLSPGTNLDKYKAASAQVMSAYNTVVSGPGSTSSSKAAYDAAIGDIQAKMTAFLTASKTYNASGAQYAADYNTVMNIIDSLSGTMSAQKTDAQQQLDQLTQSVSLLAKINDSVLSVSDAVNSLYSALASQAVATKTINQNTILHTILYGGVDGSHADGLDYVPFNGYRAELHVGERVQTARQVVNDREVSQEIVAELRALRKEVEQLRAEQNEQTGALIDSNYAANNMAAEKVVSGADNTAKQAAWVAKSKAVVT